MEIFRKVSSRFLVISLPILRVRSRKIHIWKRELIARSMRVVNIKFSPILGEIYLAKIGHVFGTFAAESEHHNR